MTFLFAQPTQLWLEITPPNQSESWQHKHSYSTSSNNWRGYLNQMSLNAILSYLQEEYGVEAKASPQVELYPSIWEVVNGVAITLQQKRVILIVTEAIDDEEFRVPQEWIDIPSWAGDYYLAAQINPDEQWLRIWGYTTHQHLKTEGRYDPRDRTYGLEGHELIQDWNVFWVSQELCLEEPTRIEIDALPTLPVPQAENLIKRLGNPEIIFPRLAVPFTLWGALLENDDWREQLYRQRQGETSPANVLINLSRWFENVFETAWQSPEALNLAFSASRDATSRQQQITRIKEIELGSQKVMLLIKLTTEADGRIGLHPFLYPVRDNSYLPANVKLKLLSESEETLKAVEARGEDNYITIGRFKCFPDFRFSLEVEFNEIRISEDFVV